MVELESKDEVVNRARANRVTWWKRRWVVAVLLMVTVTVGWVGYGMHQRAEAKEYLETRGFTFRYGDRWEFYGSLSVRFSLPRFLGLYALIFDNDQSSSESVSGSHRDREKITIEDWEAMRQFPQLSWIFLRHMELSEVDLADLGYWSQLEFLDLRGCFLGDREVDQLATLSNTPYLAIDNTGITDDHLARITDMKQLMYLYIGSNNLTGEGLVHIEKLPNLKILNFSHNEVTDQNLGNLKGGVIEQLFLIDNLITEKGLIHLTTFKNLGMLQIDVAGMTWEEIEDLLPQDVSVSTSEDLQ